MERDVKLIYIKRVLLYMEYGHVNDSNNPQNDASDDLKSSLRAVYFSCGFENCL